MKRYLGLFALCTTALCLGWNHTITEGDLNAESTLVMSATVKNNEEVGPKLAQIYPAVAQFISSHGIKANGFPFARYHHYEPGVAIAFEAGFVTEKPAQGEGDIKASELPKTHVLHVTHMGPYESIAPAYEALHAYMNSHKMEANGGPWEIYPNDPTQVKPEEIQTEIFYPVK